MGHRLKNPNSMSFLDHSRELRKRVLLSALVIFAAFFALIYFSQPILVFLSKPLTDLGQKLYFLKVQESLMAVMETSFWAAVIITSPFWLAQIIGFILPALEKRQRRILFALLASCVIFLLAGFAFSYLVLIPMSLKFLLGFSGRSLEGIISIEYYLEYFLTLFFMTGLIFQMPLAMLSLNRLGILDRPAIRKYRKIAIVGIFIVAAVITPPDVVSQILIAVPMYALFELGALLCHVFSKKDARIAKEA